MTKFAKFCLHNCSLHTFNAESFTWPKLIFYAENYVNKKLWQIVTFVLAGLAVSVAVLFTSALVGGRVYGPTYYAQYGGNLQPLGNILQFFSINGAKLDWKI